jgi:hypothetical protein
MLTNLQKLSGKTSDFQKILADVPPSMQSYVQALALGTGTTKTLQAVLELTGATRARSATTPRPIGDAAKGAGKDVHDWDVVQKNFNQRMSEAGGQFEKVKIALGQDLLPLFTSAATKAADFGKWLGKYPGWVEASRSPSPAHGGLILTMKAAQRRDRHRARHDGPHHRHPRGVDRFAARRRRGRRQGGGERHPARRRRGRRHRPAHMTRLLGPDGPGGRRGAGGETAALGGMSATALGVAIAGPIVAALGGTFAGLQGFAGRRRTVELQGGGRARRRLRPGHGRAAGKQAVAGGDRQGARRLSHQPSGQNTTVRSPGRTGRPARSQDGQFKGVITGIVGEGRAAALTAEQVDQLVRRRTRSAGHHQPDRLIRSRRSAFTVLNVAGLQRVVANENYQAVDRRAEAVGEGERHEPRPEHGKGRANTDAIIAQAGAINEVDTAYFKADSAKPRATRGRSTTSPRSCRAEAGALDQATRLGISQGPRRRSSSTRS